MKFKCPNCFNEISIKEKLRLNAATNTFCKNCGQKINTPLWISLLSGVLIFFAVYFTFQFVHSLIGRVVCGIAIFVLSVVMDTVFTPIKKGK